MMTDETNPHAMPFLSHLEELRWRLVKSLATVLGLSIVGYFFSSQAIDIITRPVGEVYFMKPTEAFGARIKMSLFLGAVAAFPVVVYQAWRFIAPGLFASEARMVVPLVLFASLFFAGGATFCFFIVLPVGIEFLIGFGTESMKPLMAVGGYVGFVGWMCIAFGIVFELPVVAYFLGRIGLIDTRIMQKGRRYAIVGILIVAAAITPSPDVFSQLMLAGPLYLLYEASILVVRAVNPADAVRRRDGTEGGDADGEEFWPRETDDDSVTDHG